MEQTDTIRAAGGTVRIIGGNDNRASIIGNFDTSTTDPELVGHISISDSNRVSARRLDAGAGTGLVGEAIAQQGYTNLTAVDLTDKMLAIAKEKQVYKSLHQCNLEDSCGFSNSANFDAIIAAGVFTHVHAGKASLNN